MIAVTVLASGVLGLLSLVLPAASAVALFPQYRDVQELADDRSAGSNWSRRAVLGGRRNLLWLLPGEKGRAPRSDRGAAIRMTKGNNL